MANKAGIYVQRNIEVRPWNHCCSAR